MSSNQNLWIVRIAPNANYDYTEKYVGLEKIMIGWKDELKINYFDIKDEKAFKKLVKEGLKTNKEEGINKQIDNYLGTICSFNKIKNGDFVIVPTKGSGDLWIGEVVDDKVIKENDDDAGYSKVVKFFNDKKPYKKEDFSREFMATIRSNRTISNASQHLDKTKSIIYKNKKILYFRIGYCDSYCGDSKDVLRGNMKWIQKNDGHEVKNFYNNNGFTYGYVPRVNGLNLRERFGAEKDQESVEGVTVVWYSCKTDNDEESNVIVGWYENATVFAKSSEIEANEMDNGDIINYIARTNIDDAHLILKKDRPKLKRFDKNARRFGQKNVFYGNKKLNLNVLKWISQHKSAKLTDPSIVAIADNFYNKLTNKSSPSGNSSTPSQQYKVLLNEMERVIEPKHHLVEKAFRQYLTKNKYEIMEQKHYIDCIYKDDRNRVYFAELKPYEDENSYKYNLRNAIGQIISYYYAGKDDHKNIGLKVVMGACVKDCNKSESSKKFKEFIEEKYQIEIMHLSFDKIEPFINKDKK